MEKSSLDEPGGRACRDPSRARRSEPPADCGDLSRGPLWVTDIAERAGLSAALVSHHLRVLKATRVVKAKRRGKQVFYGTLDDHVRCVIRDMVGHVGGSTTALEKQDDERRPRRKKQ